MDNAKFLSILLGNSIVDVNKDNECAEFLMELFSKPIPEACDTLKELFLNDPDLPEEFKKMSVVEIMQAQMNEE